MKTRNISINSSLILHFLTSGVSMPQSIWAMLVGAFVYRCATIVVLGSTLALNAAAQSEVPTVKRKIKLAFQLADLWVPYGKTCIFYDMPNYNSTTGIWSVAMGNQGKASSPKCSLRIIEQRPEDIDSISGGGWKTYKKGPGHPFQCWLPANKCTSKSKWPNLLPLKIRTGTPLSILGNGYLKQMAKIKSLR